MSSVPLVLVVIGDSASQQAAMAFDAAGLAVEMVTAAEVAGAVAAKRPALVWASGDLGQSQTSQVLEASGAVPVALLTKDPSDAVVVRHFRTAVVELFAAPFTAKTHAPRVVALLAELPRRSGALKLKGTGRELRAVVDHLTRARRSGTLTVTGASKDAATGLFFQGKLQECQWGPVRGPEMISMLAANRSPLAVTFAEQPPEAEEEFVISRGSGEHEHALAAPASAPRSLEFELEPEAPLQLERSSAPLQLEDDAPLELERPAPSRPGASRAAPSQPPQRASGPRAQPSQPVAPPPSARRGEVGPRSSPTAAITAALEDLEALTSPLPSPQRRGTPELDPSYESKVLASAPRPSSPGGQDSDPLAIEDPLLFIDDDEALLNLMATYFGKKGYPVATASDGLQGLEKLAASRFSLVIADLSMPRLDGWGFLKRAREDVRIAETPIALFSAQDDFRERLRAHHAGAHGYFQKSIKLQALEPQVRELLEPRRRFRRLLLLGQSVSLDFSALGPQWVLRQLAQGHFTGALDATEGFSRFDLRFDQGQLNTAFARPGSSRLEGQSALERFLSTKGATGTLSFKAPVLEHHFDAGATELVLEQAAHHLNEERLKVRDLALRGAKGLEVDPALFALYVANGPSVWQPIVKLLCEDRLAPREVMTRLQVTPQELTQVVHDLLRRGVVALKA
ncbi:MAG: response regulator [Myxococcaceae bacterium]|nr:response regulator [Myxococcaceae bacterium]